MLQRKGGTRKMKNCYSQAAYDKYLNDDKAATIKSSGGSYGGGSENLIAENTNQLNYVVRRLTPLECERLQGFPDGWTDMGEYIDSKGKNKKATDSNRYKALGNSIALPPWFYVLSKLSLCCGAENTMASLFDGIGGFPLIWETLNGTGSCLWASEIEEFPIAVTKKHFPDKE
jgi:DNA (cytosine-5)-methyltransferase 1